MYQLANNKQWQADYYHDLMSDKRIFSTIETKQIRQDLEHLGVLPKFDNHFEWARLCIAYCFAKNLHEDINLDSKASGKGYEIPSFNTCFGDEVHLWLAILSEHLFSLQPNATKEDLYCYIEQLWHIGACQLWERHQKCQEYAGGDVPARQQFIKELLDLTAQNNRTNSNIYMADNSKNISSFEAIDQNSIISALKNLGIPVASVDFIKKGVRFDNYQVILDKYFDLTKKHTAICSALGKDGDNIRIKPSSNGKAFCYDVNILRSSSEWQIFDKLKFEQALRQFTPNGFELPICVGLDDSGQAIFEDLTAAPHLLVAGTTGSGKSVCMRAIVQSLFTLNDDSSKIEVMILDPKKVDYHQFAGEQNLTKIIDNNDEMLAVLKESVDEMETRYLLMQSNGVDKWQTLRKTEKLPYRIIIIDEMADLLNQNKEVEDLLIRLAQKARAAGIHLILSTQSPNSEVLSTTLRANVPSRIAFRTQTAKQSEIILDETGAENLLGKGDHLVKYDGKKTYFAHGYHI